MCVYIGNMNVSTGHFNVKSTDYLHVDEIGPNHLPVDATLEQFLGINIKISY